MTTAKTIAKALISRDLTLATAESCTGGLVAHTLTNIPGSSAFFKAGFITYANEAKAKLLKVPSRLLERHGAVSSPVARAMAQGARKAAKSDIAVALTGIAGPSGGSAKKPVGLVFIAAASAGMTVHTRYVFKGTRLKIKRQAMHAALTLVEKMLKR